MLAFYIEGWCINFNLSLEDDDHMEDDEEEEEELEEDDEDERETVSTARPRRMSEIKITNKAKPIPPASSLFIFSPTNKYVQCLWHYYEIQILMA